MSKMSPEEIYEEWRVRREQQERKDRDTCDRVIGKMVSSLDSRDATDLIDLIDSYSDEELLVDELRKALYERRSAGG